MFAKAGPFTVSLVFPHASHSLLTAPRLRELYENCVTPAVRSCAVSHEKWPSFYNDETMTKAHLKLQLIFRETSWWNFEKEEQSSLRDMQKFVRIPVESLVVEMPLELRDGEDDAEEHNEISPKEGKPPFILRVVPETTTEEEEDEFGDLVDPEEFASLPKPSLHPESADKLGLLGNVKRNAGVGVPLRTLSLFTRKKSNASMAVSLSFLSFSHPVIVGCSLFRMYYF